MDVTLPNGRVIQGIPEGTSRDEIKAKAIAAGLAAEADFAPVEEGRNPDFQPQPSAMPEPERGIGGRIFDFFTGKEGERGVFAAPELNEMSFRAARAGLGGLLEGNPEELQKIIASNYPEAQFGQMQGQPSVRLPSGDYFLNPEGIDPLDVARFGTDVAAFIPAGRVAGAGGRALAKGAGTAMATQSGLQGVEAATGGEFNPEDVLIEGAVQGAGQLAEAGIRAAAPSVKEFASPLIDKVRQRFSRNRPDAPYEEVAKNITSRDASRALPDIMADPEVMRAANELGINVNPGVYSTSDIYREMENSLKMLPGSQLSANEKQTLRDLGTRADELIFEFTGTLDKSAISGEIEEQIGKTILDLENEADAIYGTLRETIPPSLKINPSETAGYIRQLADDFGSVEDLDPRVQRIFSQITREGGVNYALLDQLRKDVGSAISGQGPFRDASQNQMKALYRTLTDDTMKAAEFFGLEDMANAGKALIRQRKELEDVAQSALGRNLSRSVMAELGLGVRQLQQGKVAKFDQVMEAIPPSMRQMAAMSALNDVFAGGARTSKGFSLSGFVNAYDALERNNAISQKFFNYLPNEVRPRLENIYRVSKGLMDLNQRDLNNPSGTARAVIGAMDAPDGVLSKLYRIGRGAGIGAAATSPFDAGMTGASIGIYDAIRAGKRKATEAADQMLSSEAFKNAMQKYIEGDSAAANGILGLLRSTNTWIDSQDAAVKRAIARQGLIQYLTNTDEAPEDEPNPNQ